MPTVVAQGKTFECESGANLRRVLLQNGIDLYNGQAKVINCRGIGTCGTCAVQVEGVVSEANWKDKLTSCTSTSSLRFQLSEVDKVHRNTK